MSTPLTMNARKRCVKTFITSGPEQYQRWQTSTVRQTGSSQSMSSIRIDTALCEQTIDGFGACFNELGWHAIQALDRPEQEAILKAFFAPEGACRFNYCRMPMGANDFATSWYSYNEHRNDHAMEHFSIERDREAILPFIKAAQTINPELKVWASPWCPPKWMKESGNYASTSVNSNWGQILGHDNKDLHEASRLKEDPDTLAAYALYFVKFIQAYKKEGITISAVHPQNEVFANQIFPSCLWSKELMVTFIAEYLHPALQKAGLNTEIWAGTINGDEQAYTEWVVNHPALKEIICGAGFQWAAKNFIADLKHPTGLKLMQTESECHNGSNDWETGEVTFDLITQFFKAGAHAYMYWNFALDEWGLSNWGWRQNSLISIHQSEGTLSLNPDFYAMRHFSGLVNPGARFLRTESTGEIISAAFRNPNGEVVITGRNPTNSALLLQIEIDGEMFELNLPARHMMSLVV